MIDDTIEKRLRDAAKLLTEAASEMERLRHALRYEITGRMNLLLDLDRVLRYETPINDFDIVNRIQRRMNQLEDSIESMTYEARGDHA